MINALTSFGKFLDQPILTAKLNKQLPYLLTGMGTLFMLKETNDSFQKTTNQTSKEKQQIKKDLLNKSIVLAASISTALIAPKIAAKIFKRPMLESIEKIKDNNTNAINEFLSKNSCDENYKNILNKAKERILSYKEINKLRNLTQAKEQKDLFEQIIPNPKDITAKDIFKEIGYLSVYGAIPVAGGIAGGIVADEITHKKVKEKIPDKINEGIYQYLANIFMCNIGAGVALGILEKTNVKSRMARAIGMTTGIILTGIVGGSKIANLIAKNIISPILNPKKKKEEISYRERRPELLDVGLHSDDIATISLLSGLKWIEPTLPALYSISGYRAGIGYRN